MSANPHNWHRIPEDDAKTCSVCGVSAWKLWGPRQEHRLAITTDEAGPVWQKRAKSSTGWRVTTLRGRKGSRPRIYERTVVRLYRLAALLADGYSVDEAAGQLGVSKSSLYDRIRHQSDFWKEVFGRALEKAGTGRPMRPERRPDTIDNRQVKQLLEAIRERRDGAGPNPARSSEAPEALWTSVPTGPVPGQTNGMTLAGFFERVYLPLRLIGRSQTTVADYRSVINRFCAWAGRSVTLAELSDELVAGYMAYSLQHRSPATVNGHRRNILALWRFAKRRKLVDTSPDVEPVRAYKRQPECWSIEEFERVLAAAGETPGMVGRTPAGVWWVGLLLTDFDTGLRIGALLAIERDDVDLSHGWLLARAQAQKQRADQRFRLHRDTVAVLRQFKENGSPRFFAWARPFRALDREFQRILDRAKVTHGHRHGGNFHKIRRTSATYVANKLGKAAAQEHLGHSQLSVTECYLDMSKIDRVQAADVLPRPVLPKTKLGGEPA